MDTHQTKTLVNKATELSKRASSLLEQAQAFSLDMDSEACDVSDETAAFLEQAQEAVEQLNEVVDSINDNKKVTYINTKHFREPTKKVPTLKLVPNDFADPTQTPTVQVEVLPSIWEWDDDEDE